MRRAASLGCSSP
jgi:hypothetical protein